jgi:hypothetical protein
VLCGPKGAERLDVSGRHHGLRGRIYRETSASSSCARGTTWPLVVSS